MDFVKSHFGKIQSEVTSYKIHTLASLALQVCKFMTDMEHQIVNLKPPNVCALSKVKTELMVHAVDAVQMLPLLV